MIGFSFGFSDCFFGTVCANAAEDKKVNIMAKMNILRCIIIYTSYELGR